MHKDIEKYSPEWTFFGEFREFRKKYYYPEDNDAFWESMIDAADRLNRKYEHADFAGFAKRLILAHMDDADMRSGKGMNINRRDAAGKEKI